MSFDDHFQFEINYYASNQIINYEYNEIEDQSLLKTHYHEIITSFKIIFIKTFN